MQLQLRTSIQNLVMGDVLLNELRSVWAKVYPLNTSALTVLPKGRVLTLVAWAPYQHSSALWRHLRVVEFNPVVHRRSLLLDQPMAYWP